jgi:CheY-like chemotaxis protein
MTNSIKAIGKPKKDIKWYTYVDSQLNTKLKEFMETYSIKNQAKFIRKCVGNCIDYLNIIFQKKTFNDPKEFNPIELDNLIREAINIYEVGNNFHNELKQKLSPLKLSVLMLDNYIEEKERLLDGFHNVKCALDDLELSVKKHFEEPDIIRYIRKIDVLYIEDNELERETVKYFFERKNLTIRSVETSEEALYLLKKLTPRVILLDINLKTSNLNGDQLCKMLKSSEHYNSIPIVLISAVFPEIEKENLFANTGADEVIFKPIDHLSDLDVIYKYTKEL